MINATPNTQPNTNNSDSSSPVSPQPVKLTEYIKDNSPQKTPESLTTTTTTSVNTTSNTGSSDTVQPKKKYSLKLILGVIVLLLIILGSGAGFYLSQQQQELRQQAYVGASCTTNDQCNANQKTPGVAEYCIQGTCSTSANGMCAFSACDAECSLTSCNVSCNSGLNCSTGKNTFYCRGQHASCNSANSFKSDNSGSVNSTLADNWCTTYQIDSWAKNNVNGSIEESAAEIGFIGRNGKVCKWNDSACISSDPNFWNCDSSGAKTISGKAYCELEAPTSPLYAINNVPIKVYNSAAANIANAVTAGVGTYSTSFSLNVGSTFAVRVGGGTGNASNPAFKGAGATWCNPQHENCPFPSMPTTQPNIDFKTNVVPTTLANTCSADGHMTITWNKATNYDGTKVTNYILRLDYDESQDPGGNPNTWKPGTIAEGGNPNDYWRYVPTSVGTCTATTCTVNTTIFNQETGANAKPWKPGKYIVNVNPVANSTVPGPGATVIELCRASQTFTCNPQTMSCNSICTTNTQCSNVNPAWSCVTIEGSAEKRCRLTSNPTSNSCQPATVYQCNSDCTVGSGEDPCTTTNSAWSCVNNKCRLTANPGSTSCQPETPVAPMCKDVAILDEDNAELDPKAVPSSFYIGQVIKLRCAPDNVQNPQIEKYQFRITEPGNVVIEGNALNPSGNSAISLPYQITKSGTFKAQCRICLTGGTCQPYIDITN